MRGKIKRSTFAARGLGVCYNTPEGDGGGTRAVGTGNLDVPTLTHTQCINRIREINSELSRLQELDLLSPEDEQYFKELTTEFGTVNNHRKKLERAVDLGKIAQAAKESNAVNLRGVRGQDLSLERGNGGGSLQPGATTSDDYDVDAFLNPDSVEAVRFRNPWKLDDVRTFGRSKEDVNQELRARALSAIEQMPGANDKIRSAGTEILEKFDDGDARIARLVLHASSPTYLRAFAKAATNRQNMMTDEEKRSMDSVRALSLTDSAGGFLVPFQLDPTVILTANGRSPARSSRPPTSGTASARARCRGPGTLRRRRCPTTPRPSVSRRSRSTRLPGSSRSALRRWRTRTTSRPPSAPS